MNVTGAQVYTEIAYTLIETPTDGSADPSTGLYTRAEIMARLNYRLFEFNKRTGLYVKNDVLTTTATGAAVCPAPADVIDYLEVSYQSPTYNYTVIPKGSVYEADIFQTDDDISASADTPTIYSIEDSPALSISFYPPPNAASNARFCYIAVPATLPSPPDSTVLDCPDDLTPFVKYGALADLFGKSGPTYDPQRQQVCQAIYELGIDTAKAWVAGQS